jgi:nucleoside-diphosphate-sugar epimerase
VGAFNPSTAELDRLVRRAFPDANIAFAPDRRRQAIVDSWPEDVDDTRARRDWGYHAAYDLQRTFDEYLLPNITRRYTGSSRGPQSGEDPCTER